MTDISNVVNGHEFVDLGLPSGLLWATCNVGATSPEQAGLYFAFGEAEGYTTEQVENGTRKFDSASYTASAISADLTLEQDAAHIHMGGKWRMPTYDECQELIDNCNVMWTADYGGTEVAGMMFTSKVNGNSVFFPAAALCRDSSVSSVGSIGFYWSSSWYFSFGAWYLLFYDGCQHMNIGSRSYGCSVRGVCKRG